MVTAEQIIEFFGMKPLPDRGRTSDFRLLLLYYLKPAEGGLCPAIAAELGEDKQQHHQQPVTGEPQVVKRGGENPVRFDSGTAAQ